MLIAYLDESYTKDRYYIAAFVIDEEQIPLLEEALADAMEYAAGFGVGPDVELHAHSLMSGRDGWEPVRGIPRAAIAIYENALSRIAELPGVMYIRGVDVPRLHARYSYPRTPHSIALQYVLEEVSDFGRSRNEMVRVIADEVENQQGHADQVKRYQQSTTPGYRPNSLAWLEDPIQFASSARTPGLQVADLIAYIYRRYDGHTEPHPRTRRAVERMWRLLQPIWGSVWVWVP